MPKMINGYSWATDKRTTEFILRDADKWMKQNEAECLDIVEGCMLDNLVMSCKRGTAFLFEDYVNEWTSHYRVYFIPYKEQDSNPDYDRLWDRFYSLQALSEAQ